MKILRIGTTGLVLLCLAWASVHSVQAAPQELKAVAFLPKNHPLATMSVVWVKRVNKELSGDLKIRYVGGPEVTASKEQIQAVKNGVFQINFNVTSYYSPLAPELNAFQLSKLKPWEERRPGGFYDFMVKRHEKIGVRYLGRWVHGGFYLWSKKKITDPAEFSGAKYRTGPMYIYFMKKLGVAAVSMRPSDVFTALERGTVDGFAWPLLGPRKLGWTKHVKYLVDHPFYGMDTTIIMNLDSWKKMKKSARKRLISLTAEFERDMVTHFQTLIDKEYALLEKSGVQRVKFSEAGKRKFLAQAYDSYWEQLEKKVPDMVPELKRITGN